MTMIRTPPLDPEDTTTNQILMAEPPNPFFDPVRISRASFDPKKNFLKILWQKGKPPLDSEFNEREDIDNFIRRQLAILLSGKLTVVGGLCPKETNHPSILLLTAGELVVRGWQLTIEKNGGGFPSIEGQNYSVLQVDPNDGSTIAFPRNGIGFSPNLQFDQPVGDNTATILSDGTGFDTLKRQLCVTLENTCAVGPMTYIVQTLDGFYSQMKTVPAQGRATFCLKEDLTNIVRLPANLPHTGTRTDYVYLQVGEVEVCATVANVKRNGHVSHPESVPANIFDPIVGQETTRRTQIQFDLLASAGHVPPAPHGFYIYPLFRILRRAGQPHVKLEDITPLVPRLDLERSGLLELIADGANIQDQTVDVLDGNMTMPPAPLTMVVGSTLHVRNKSMVSPRTMKFVDPIDPSVDKFETFKLRTNESECITFNKTGDFNLVDVGPPGDIIATVTIIPWGSGGTNVQTVDTTKCAIGLDYFPETGPIHACDDSSNPRPGTEQSLDVRVESLFFDNFRLALNAAKNTNDGNYYDCFYLYVTDFTNSGSCQTLTADSCAALNHANAINFGNGIGFGTAAPCGSSSGDEGHG